MEARVPVHMTQIDPRDGHPSEKLVGVAEVSETEIVIRIKSSEILDHCEQTIPIGALRGFHVGFSYLPAEKKED